MSCVFKGYATHHVLPVLTYSLPTRRAAVLAARPFGRGIKVWRAGWLEALGEAANHHLLRVQQNPRDAARHKAAFGDLRQIALRGGQAADQEGRGDRKSVV